MKGIAALLVLLAAGCNHHGTCTVVSMGGSQATRKAPPQSVAAGDTPSLLVDSHSGRVHVRAGGEGPVQVEALLQGPTEADLDRIRVDVVNDDGKVRIGWTAEGSRNDLSVAFTITTPQGSTVDVETGAGSVEVRGGSGALRVKTGGGSVTVEGREGSVRLETAAGSVTVEGGEGSLESKSGGGSVTVTRRSGPLALRTEAGSITVEGGRGAAVADTGGGRISLDGRRLEGECAARTRAGSIEVLLAADASLRVDGRTDAGSVTTDFPLAVSKGISPRTVQGTLGDGKGGSLTLESGGGSLNLRRK